MLTTHFQDVLHHLAEGDLAFYGALCQALCDVPASIEVGDLFVATGSNQLIWYEVLEVPRQGRVFVRCYSRILKRGEYDCVSLEALSASVTRGLFERARAHGFRTVRRSD